MLLKLELVVVVCLMMLLGGFGAGWFSKDYFVEKAAVKVAQKEQRATDIVIPKLEQEKSKIESQKPTIVEVTRYVQVNPQCNLSRGAVGVLNRARGVPLTPGLPDEKEPTPSSVTQREEVEYHADCATRYRTLAVEHDELIDWLVRSR